METKQQINEWVKEASVFLKRNDLTAINVDEIAPLIKTIETAKRVLKRKWDTEKAPHSDAIDQLKSKYKEDYDKMADLVHQLKQVSTEAVLARRKAADESNRKAEEEAAAMLSQAKAKAEALVMDPEAETSAVIEAAVALQQAEAIAHFIDKKRMAEGKTGALSIRRRNVLYVTDEQKLARWCWANARLETIEALFAVAKKNNIKPSTESGVGEKTVETVV